MWWGGVGGSFYDSTRFVVLGVGVGNGVWAHTGRSFDDSTTRGRGLGWCTHQVGLYFLSNSFLMNAAMSFSMLNWSSACFFRGAIARRGKSQSGSQSVYHVCCDTTQQAASVGPQPAAGAATAVNESIRQSHPHTETH